MLRSVCYTIWSGSGSMQGTQWGVVAVPQQLVQQCAELMFSATDTISMAGEEWEVNSHSAMGKICCRGILGLAHSAIFPIKKGLASANSGDGVTEEDG